MKYVEYDFVDVLDDEIFTLEKANEWNDYIVDNYKFIYEEFENVIDNVTPVEFTLNKMLLNETIIDAIIGMRKIVDSKNNSVEDPNSFKIMAYLSYWWLRHKPISVYYPTDITPDKILVVREKDETDPVYEKRCKKLCWQLNHINELVAVQFVINYIFDFDEELCNDKRCKKNAKKDNNFCFESFEEMKDVLLQKLLYYFSYRALAPKMIEHFLEGYTWHPAWKYTGNHWTIDLENNDENYNEII